MSTKPVALVPAYKPEAEIGDIVSSLIASGVFSTVYCVDDGSGREFEERFHRLEAMGVKRIRHAINLGKGMALRSGLNAIACMEPGAPSVITFDADGQHQPGDILSIARAGIEHNGSLVLGARTLPEHAPLRSRFGNRLTRHVLKFFTDMDLQDTQTGLRAIPTVLIPHLLRVKTTGYDFELDMLILAHRLKIPVKEVSITGVYMNGNASSHFNPLLDSMRIYFVFLRFSSVSLTTALIDYVIFSVMFLYAGNIGLSFLAARLLAATYQFTMSRLFVFKKTERIPASLFKYGLVLVGLSLLTYSGISACVSLLDMSPFIAKILTESVVFIFSFLLLRDFVFLGNPKVDGDR